MVNTIYETVFESRLAYCVTVCKWLIVMALTPCISIPYEVALAGMPDSSIGEINGNRRHRRNLSKTRLFPIFWLYQSGLTSYFKLISIVGRSIQGNVSVGQNFQLHMERRKRKRKYNRIN